MSSTPSGASAGFRTLATLAVCQLISGTGSMVMVTLGGIIGTQLAPDKAWATLPMSMSVLALAATTVPAAMLMRRIGRRYGFAFASCTSIVALGIAIFALWRESFGWYLAATACFGINLAFTQQYRYAAAESVDSRYVARAISLVLLGSIGAAFLGKELATRGQFWIESIPYAGTMLALMALFAVQAMLFLSLDTLGYEKSTETAGQGRPLRQVVRQPLFAVAVLGGAAGFGIMMLVMTATPLSMHVENDFSLEQTATVIKYHVLAMYVPSLVTGLLIERYGVSRLMLAGAIALLLTAAIGLKGHSFLHYWWALVLLGVGWNFLYVGGTTMLTLTYRQDERFAAQAVNEFLVFGASATASLLAGTIMHWFGWGTLMWLPVPILLLVGCLILLTRNDPLLAR